MSSEIRDICSDGIGGVQCFCSGVLDSGVKHGKGRMKIDVCRLLFLRLLVLLHPSRVLWLRKILFSIFNGGFIQRTYHSSEPVESDGGEDVENDITAVPNDKLRV